MLWVLLYCATFSLGCGGVYDDVSQHLVYTVSVWCLTQQWLNGNHSVSGDEGSIPSEKEYFSFKILVSKSVSKYNQEMTNNWDLFVLGPLLAILSTPRPVCVRFSLNSSLKGVPHIEVPPENKTITL